VSRWAVTTYRARNELRIVIFVNRYGIEEGREMGRVYVGWVRLRRWLEREEIVKPIQVRIRTRDANRSRELFNLAPDF
jgi:hypothetical protein